MKWGILTISAAALLLVLAGHGGALAAEDDAGEGGGAAFNWYALVKPLGIATLSSLVLTFAAGVFRRKLGRRFKKIHVALALTTVVLGVSHGLLVIILWGL
ncbi:MAG: hypothetical protein ACYS8Z_15630 [Planctomycetota bacterium]|jgi:hypothetical protein